MTEQTRKVPERQAYLRVGHGLIETATDDRIADGEQLVRQCLSHFQWRDGIEGGEVLEDQGDFPPRLLILLATVACQPFDELLTGIRKELEARELNVPLVGCSVAGVLTEADVLLKGATLVCIGSRFVEASVATAENALATPTGAAKALCERFGLIGDAINAKRNAFFLAFLPGFIQDGNHKRYRATEIHAALREETKCQIPMVGGVATDDFQRDACWTFVNGEVSERGAAVALVESDLRFGIGISHGLSATKEILFPCGVSSDGHRISRFGRIRDGQLDEVAAESLLEERQRILLMGEVTSEDQSERVVLHALPAGNGDLMVTRPVQERRPLECLRCDADELRATPERTVKLTLDGSQIDAFHLGLAIRFPSAARYEYACSLGMDVREILATMHREHAGVPIVSGLMSGEIGQGPSGRNLCRSWTVSNLLLADEIHPRSFHRRGYEALSRAGEEMGGAATVTDAISAALDAITDAGFPGGMISLLLRDRDSHAIVAQQARGEGWQRIVPSTRRWAGQKDILVVVAEERTPQFVPDAREGEFNHPEAVHDGKVISYYVAPLVAPDGIVIGALQVGLGDMSNLTIDEFPTHLSILLQSFASQIATSLSRAIQMHELRLSELLDRAVKESIVHRTVAEAAQRFVDVVIADDAVHGTHMVHIRLADTEDKYLDLVAGAGAYYLSAKQYRPRASVSDPSPTARAYRTGKSTWVNDATGDAVSRDFLSFLDESPDLQDSLEEMKSYANLLIRPSEADKPIGVLTIASPEPWQYTESMWRSMQTLGQRLYVVLQHVQTRQAENQRVRELDFLMEMTPQLSVQDLKTALREHAAHIAHAACAQKVSFFLWDPETERYVLRGQHGWVNEAAVGQAFYSPGEGMTGTLAQQSTPTYIRDLRVWRRSEDLPPGAKHDDEMFGKRLPHDRYRYEVLAIPLGLPHLGAAADADSLISPLGILTLQNAIERGGAETLFTTRDDRLLEEVQDDITAFLAASLGHAETERLKQEESRIAEVARLLLHPVADAFELARRVCRHLTRTYDLGGCTLYVPDEQAATLRLACPPYLANSGLAEVVPSSPNQEIEMQGTVLGASFASGRRYSWSPEFQPKPRPDESVYRGVAPVAASQLLSVLAQPVRRLGCRPVGLLVAWNIRQQPEAECNWFTRHDQREFQRTGELVAQRLDQQRISRDEQRMLFLGTLRTNLAHLVGSQISLVTLWLKEANEGSGTLPKDRWADIVERCQLVLDEVGRVSVAVNNAWPDEYHEVELKSILERAIDLCRQKAVDKSIDLKNLCDDGIYIRGDRQQLEQVLRDIIDNGLNAMSSGELTVQSCADEDDEQVRVHIDDQGYGMSKDVIEAILSNPPELSKEKRVPLGTALAKFVIEHHGGTLDYRSAVEEGTTAVITLPYVRLEK